MRFTYRAAGPITAAVCLTLLCGCSRTQRDWRAAQQAGTPQAYAAFVARHADSELAGVARQRIAQLTEETAWEQAARTNTAAAYRDYLAKYPNGSWSQDARIRMESRSLASAPPAPQPQGTAGGTAAPVATQSLTTQPPSPTSAPPAPIARLNSAVQLGAFSSDANAREAWRRLSFRFRSQLAGLTSTIVPVTVSGRRLYRLEAHVASQSAARRLCRQLQQQSQGCLPLA
jgi:cell division septation protein DedD